VERARRRRAPPAASAAGTGAGWAAADSTIGKARRRRLVTAEGTHEPGNESGRLLVATAVAAGEPASCGTCSGRLRDV
jgi:hypothetical protein